VGVGIVAGASDRIGEEVYIYAKGATVAAKLVSPTHFDARGERLNG
jgi:sarcosine oxidase subunit alpha